MKYVRIGKIVNTHGIRGEVRLLSDFKFKDRVFKKNFIIYIGKNKDKEIIEEARKKKVLNHIFNMDVSDDVYENLKELV